MSKQNGLFVFTATPEMVSAMPKVFRSGQTYIAQRADAVIDAARPNAVAGRKAGTSGKKVGKKVSNKVAAKKASKTSTPKAATPKLKGGRGKKAGSPELVVQFVRENEGCNMTQIEAATKMAQPDIRKALNDAREAGLIRTEGQRRGLRYFATGATAATAPEAGKTDSAGAPSGTTPW